MSTRKLHGEHMLTDAGRVEWVSRNAQASALATSPYKWDFPLLARKPDLAFLDSAATAQRPYAVLEAQKRFYETMNANALRGLYELSVEATEAINASRAHVARFLGLDGRNDARDIVFCRNASEALNIVARSYAPTVLGPADEVCITVMEHHSNLIPWQQACRAAGAKLVYMYPDEEGVISEEEMRAKIGPRTKIVSAVHVSNVLGVANDVKLMAQIAHEFDAVMVVDGAQSAPHFPIDLNDLGCDFFAFSAHKVYGPFGIGVLWGRHDLLDAMPPFLTGGEMIDAVTEQTATWAPSMPYRRAKPPSLRNACAGFRNSSSYGSSVRPILRRIMELSASTCVLSIRMTLRAFSIWMGWPSAPGTIALSRCWRTSASIRAAVHRSLSTTMHAISTD